MFCTQVWLEPQDCALRLAQGLHYTLQQETYPMPVSITANASARYAQSSLVKQNESLTKSTLRMSTGKRVLSAADDAAAMAIGTSLKIENSGLKSAIQNATSATSMLQIADGALGQISELLTRLQVLAVQSSSGQYDDSTRMLLDGEFQGLKQEIDRLAGATSFNDVNILSGTPKFDVTATPALVTDGIKNIRLDPSLVSGEQDFRYSYDSATERLTMSRIDGGTTTSQSIDLTPLLDGSVGQGVDLQGNQALEVSFSTFGITLTLGSEFARGTDLANGVVSTPGANISVATPTFAVGNTNAGYPKLKNLDTLTAGAYNAGTGVLGLQLVSDGDSSTTGTVTLAAIPGISYKVNGAAATASGAVSDNLVGTTATVEVYGDVTGGGQVLLGTITTGAVASTAAGTGSLALNVGGGLITATQTDEIAPTHLTYKVGTGVIAGQDTIGVDIPAMTLKALGLTSLSINSATGSNSAIDALKDALTVLNQGRATVGAQQLRLEAVGRNLGVISDNNEAARSSLIDVDVSQEISDLTNSQAMMQASIAMLTRANQQPDILLKLLQ